MHESEPTPPLSSPSSSPVSSFSDASASPWLYDETGAFVSKPTSTKMAAERQWASANRASSRRGPEPIDASAGPPPPVERPESNGPSPDPSFLSPQSSRRPHSFYLPLDGSGSSAPASPSAAAWPFAQGPGHFLSQPPDTPLLKSPSQLNPVFAVPSAAELAAGARRGVAEPYVGEGRYGAGLPAAYRASPPIGYDPENGGFSPTLSKNEEDKRRFHEPRPFYRTPSGSISQAYRSPSASAAGDDSFTSVTTPRAHGFSTSVPRPSPLRQKLDSSTAWLIYYFAFNLGLTIYNKRVLQGFPFPWTLTGVHTLCGAAGSQLALNYRFFSPGRLTRREGATLVAFSVLYTVNIAVSNVSLQLVTIPFHQVVRATTPLFTILLSMLYFRRSYPAATFLALFVVVLGVGLSTYGDYGWTSWGLFLTLLGTLLAALKTVVTNALLVGRLKLHPLDLLMRMSPLAFVQCVVVSWWSGEMERVREYGATRMTGGKAVALAVNGVIAFGLNVVSFTANKKTSALTMTVAANIKQVLTIVLAVFVFDLVIGPLNFSGITLTLLGGAWYAKVELDQKNAKSKASVAGKGLGGSTAPRDITGENGNGVAMNGAAGHKYG